MRNSNNPVRISIVDPRDPNQRSASANTPWIRNECLQLYPDPQKTKTTYSLLTNGKLLQDLLTLLKTDNIVIEVYPNRTGLEPLLNSRTLGSPSLGHYLSAFKRSNEVIQTIVGAYSTAQDDELWQFLGVCDEYFDHILALAVNSSLWNLVGSGKIRNYDFRVFCDFRDMNWSTDVRKDQLMDSVAEYAKKFNETSNG
jgi:hypothetical protein